MDLFSGLEDLGLGDLESLDIYEEEAPKHSEPASVEIEKKLPEVSEEDYIFDKTYTCPVCDKIFKSKTVKANRTRLISTDMDLRPVCQDIDVIKYDVVACPRCGYAVLARNFGPLTSMQIRKVKENISRKYTPTEKSGSIYTYEEAIQRNKLALLSSVIKMGKDSEKAYVCLKTAWLYRGMAENLPKGKEEEKEKYKAEEEAFLRKAYDGLIVARRKEVFPICGMDTLTYDYLLAALAYHFGDYNDSVRLLGEILLKPGAGKRVKDKARELKELLKKAIAKQNES